MDDLSKYGRKETIVPDVFIYRIRGGYNLAYY